MVFLSGELCFISELRFDAFFGFTFFRFGGPFFAVPGTTELKDVLEAVGEEEALLRTVSAPAAPPYAFFLSDMVRGLFSRVSW
jgi:hypothetical protein